MRFLLVEDSEDLARAVASRLAMGWIMQRRWKMLDIFWKARPMI
jgi:hypothetical protein